MQLTVEQSAAILHALRYKSRRSAKLAAGEIIPPPDGRKHLRAAELDALLAEIAADPRNKQIEALVLANHFKLAGQDRPRRRGT